MSIAPELYSPVFQKLERDLGKLSSKPEAKRVHRFRTGARRLQTLLKEISPDRDRNQKKLLKLVGRIRKRAGKLRDLDVQIAALRSLKFPQEPRRKTQLMDELVGVRKKQEEKLRRETNKEAVREIRKKLKRARKDFDPSAARDPLTVAAQIIEPISKASAVLPTEDLLHQFRILSKRGRYAAEFGARSPETTQFISQLRRLQDAIGDWHDWLTLTQTAANRLGDVPESPLVAALHNVTGAKFRNAVVALSAARGLLGETKSSSQAGARKKQARPSELAKVARKAA